MNLAEKAHQKTRQDLNRLQAAYNRMAEQQNRLIQIITAHLLTLTGTKDLQSCGFCASGLPHEPEVCSLKYIIPPHTMQLDTTTIESVDVTAQHLHIVKPAESTKLYISIVHQPAGVVDPTKPPQQMDEVRTCIRHAVRYSVTAGCPGCMQAKPQ